MGSNWLNSPPNRGRLQITLIFNNFLLMGWNIMKPIWCNPINWRLFKITRACREVPWFSIWEISRRETKQTNYSPSEIILHFYNDGGEKRYSKRKKPPWWHFQFPILALTSLCKDQCWVSFWGFSRTTGSSSWNFK